MPPLVLRQYGIALLLLLSNFWSIQVYKNGEGKPGPYCKSDAECFRFQFQHLPTTHIYVALFTHDSSVKEPTCQERGYLECMLTGKFSDILYALMCKILYSMIDWLLETTGP